MSRKTRNNVAAQRRAHASAFAALGDETRLALVARLAARPALLDLSADARLEAYPASHPQAHLRARNRRHGPQRASRPRASLRIPLAACRRNPPVPRFCLFAMGRRPGSPQILR